MRLERQTRKKEMKFHPELFMADGIPDNSLILERGPHLNNTALEAYKKITKGEIGDDIFSRDQLLYIEKVHFPHCQDCRKRFDDIGMEKADQQEIEF